MTDTPEQEPDADRLPAGHPGAYRRPGWQSPVRWLIVSVAGVVFVVVLVLSLTGGGDDGPGTRAGVANAVVDALNAQDEAAIRPLMCAPRVPNVLAHIEEQAGVVETHASLKGFSGVTEDRAVALINLTATYQGRSANLDFQLSMYKQAAGWCAYSFAGPAAYTRG